MSTAKKHLARPSTILSHLLPKTKPKEKEKRKKKGEISLLYLFLPLLPHPNQDLSFFKPQVKSISLSKLLFPSMATENEEAPRPALPPYPEVQYHPYFLPFHVFFHSCFFFSNFFFLFLDDLDGRKIYQ